MNYMYTKPMRAQRRWRDVKAQSAMEYLMTYGWAILIIAVVLGALFSLGVFSSGNLLGTACIAYSGYVCKSPLLVASTHTFTATVGQATGTDWATTNLIFIQQGAGNPTTTTFTASCIQTVSGGLSSGATTGMSVTQMLTTGTSCSNLPSTVGSSQAGAIWAEYTVSGASTNLISQIATINVKAS